MPPCATACGLLTIKLDENEGHLADGAVGGAQQGQQFCMLGDGYISKELTLEQGFPACGG